jgi:hypothetical protein
MTRIQKIEANNVDMQPELIHSVDIKPELIHKELSDPLLVRRWRS